MNYVTNDRLKFTLQKKSDLPMIEEGDEDTQDNKVGL